MTNLRELLKDGSLLSGDKLIWKRRVSGSTHTAEITSTGEIVLEDGNLDWSDRSGGERGFPTLVKKPVDKNAEYFVMRLDEGGKDRNHIKACRIGIHAYADAIQQFIPELANDLRERYPLL